MSRTYFNTGIKFDYNNITIQIAEGDISVSKLASSGITIGTAKDYDRVIGLTPTVCKINDQVKSVQNFACPVITSSKIIMGTTSGGSLKTYTLKKVGNKLNCKATG